MKRLTKLVLLVVITGTLFQQCAYYNTFFNAEEYFRKAREATRENQSGTVSREEINLYAKAIDKSKKVIQNYPTSKYTDDAQFIIARSYYYRGDYALAKKYFEDLSILYGNSPFNQEVPIWIARCLVEVGDLDMARHEANRILEKDSERKYKAEALLLLGEISVLQGDFDTAQRYLYQVTQMSRDGFTRAKAQFQIGRLLESRGAFEEALKAYREVSKYKPDESLKVDAIIAQVNMHKSLNRDQEAIKMIEEMLKSDKYVDIRGQLEIELGKIYLSIGMKSEVETQLKAVIDNYPRQKYAAEAAFYLGEYYLQEKDYLQARQSYANVEKQFRKTPLKARASARLKKIEGYQKIQFNYKNLELQLAGLPPLEKKKKNTGRTQGRSPRTAGKRGRGRIPIQEELEESESVLKKNSSTAKSSVKQTEGKEPVIVSAEDSLRFIAMMEKNRYSLAEYMLFEFSDVDTTVEILDELETSSRDTTLKQQAAYMRYYAFADIEKDSLEAERALKELADNYPNFYSLITSSGKKTEHGAWDSLTEEMIPAVQAFDAGDYSLAAAHYKKLSESPDVSVYTKSRALFNYAWLQDNYLLDLDASLDAYKIFIDTYEESPLYITAQRRFQFLSALVANPDAEETPDDEM